jgi:hypothetical protein
MIQTLLSAFTYRNNFLLPSDVFLGEQKPCRMIKAASSYPLSSVVKKSPRLSDGSGDRLSGGAKIFGQKCQDGGAHSIYSVCQFIELERLEWFNLRMLPTGIDKN